MFIVPFRKEGEQIKLSVENEAFKEMSGPRTMKIVDMIAAELRKVQIF
jgi:hypothetical protein